MNWIKKLFNKIKEENKRFNNLSFEKRMEYYMKFEIENFTFNFNAYMILGLTQAINYLLLLITGVDYISTLVLLNTVFSSVMIAIALIDLLINVIVQFYRSYEKNKWLKENNVR